MQKTTLKLAGLSMIAIAMTAGTAYAGAGKDCKHKKTKVTSEASATSNMETAVLATSAGDTEKAHKMHKAMSFDDAVKLCTDKGAADLQACIDYKTGKVKAKPKS